MYNLLLSLAISVVTSLLVVVAGFPVVSAILPGVLVFPLAAFLLLRRTGKQVEAAMAPVSERMMALGSATSQAQAKSMLDEVRGLLREVQGAFGWWQPLLVGQIDRQLGMLSYMEMKWDEAMPLLQSGRMPDWTSQVAVACIHYRRGDLDEAWKGFEEAATSHRKEAAIYTVWAVLASRKGLRDRALAALVQSAEHAGENELNTRLKKSVANKQRIDIQQFSDLWYRFFPEEAAQQAMVRGRKGPDPFAGRAVQVAGRPQPKVRGKMARRR